MEKEFIPYVEALALKALGFDEPCFAIYEPQEIGVMFRWVKDQKVVSNKAIGYVIAPLYQQAFRWFRKKHNLKISFAYWNGFNSALPNYMSYKYECYIISENAVSIIVRGEQDNIYFDTYEEAELACLRKLIEIVKQNKKL